MSADFRCNDLKCGTCRYWDGPRRIRENDMVVFDSATTKGYCEKYSQNKQAGQVGCNSHLPIC